MTLCSKLILLKQTPKEYIYKILLSCYSLSFSFILLTKHRLVTSIGVFFCDCNPKTDQAHCCLIGDLSMLQAGIKISVTSLDSISYSQYLAKHLMKRKKRSFLKETTVNVEIFLFQIRDIHRYAWQNIKRQEHDLREVGHLFNKKFNYNNEVTERIV